MAGIAQLFTKGGKDKAFILVELLELYKEFSFELLPKHSDQDEKMVPHLAHVTAEGKTSTGNNTVHIHMIVQFLVPDMENLDDAGCCAEEFFIGRQLHECCDTAFVENS